MPGEGREIMEHEESTEYVPIPENVTGVIDKDGEEWHRTYGAE
jgi:hypothetical protein